ncbi:MCE family protein [Rhodobacterales bacterium HKCCE3408]|nr:MCE family protein [Rhodobacterales bacterium HKCCE3408]
METRANYILIGAFTIAGIVGLLAFFFAFARLELDRSLAYYDVNFDSVAGLSQASDVRFAGLPVGQVVDVQLSPDRDGTVRVRIEVDADTPVRSDSIATIESQGVTGVAFVAISAGTTQAELAIPETGEIGTIESGRSVIQSLTEDAPALVSEALELVRNVGDLFSGENRGRIENIITNAETASNAFAQTLEDFASVSGSVEEFVVQIERFNSVLQTIAADADTVLVTADETLTSWNEVAENARTLMDAGTNTLATVDATLASAGRYIDTDLIAATTELRDGLADIRTRISALSEQTGTMLETFTTTGTLANDRLTEVAETLDALDALIADSSTAVASVGSAAESFDTLVTDDGFALMDETRAMIANADAAISTIRTAAEEDLPGIIDDIEAATATVSEVVRTVGEDLTGASGRIEGLTISAEEALSAATETFTEANTTLSAINGAMETGERALEAAERAFDTADGVMREELGQLVSRLNETLGGLDDAITRVSADLPSISESLNNAGNAAETAFEQLAEAVQSAGPAIQNFAESGLPQYEALATDARDLARTLDSLIRRIQRDPARFFLNSEAPEYRR